MHFAFLYAPIHTRAHTHTHTHTHAHTHTHTHTRTHTHTHTHKRSITNVESLFFISSYTCEACLCMIAYACVLVCVSICMCVSLHAYVCVCMCVCACVYHRRPHADEETPTLQGGENVTRVTAKHARSLLACLNPLHQPQHSTPVSRVTS